jgi:integrase
MTVRVVWYTQKRKWYLDGPTPGKKRYRRALGPKPEDKARGEVLATKMNAQQTAMVERRAALVRGQPILGEVALRACWELSRSAYSATANPERLLKRFLVPYFGGLDLRMLTELEIQDFAGKMAQVRKQRSGSGTLGICTIENALSILRRTLYWLESRRDLDFRVPVRRILALGRAAAAAKGARRGQLLLSQLASHPELHAVCFAALHTGMRKGELLALEWDDIDFRRGTISVSKSLTQADRVKAPKSENSYRTVQMSAALHAGLDAMRRQLHARAGLDGDVPLRVFLDSTGRPWRYTTLNVIFQRARNRAHRRHGVRRLPFHSFRHTFVSWALSNREDPVWVAAQIGDRVETMFKHYTHLMPGKGKLDFLNETGTLEPLPRRARRAPVRLAAG